MFPASSPYDDLCDLERIQAKKDGYQVPPKGKPALGHGFSGGGESLGSFFDSLPKKSGGSFDDDMKTHLSYLFDVDTMTYEGRRFKDYIGKYHDLLVKHSVSDTDLAGSLAEVQTLRDALNEKSKTSAADLKLLADFKSMFPNCTVEQVKGYKDFFEGLGATAPDITAAVLAYKESKAQA